MKGAEYQLAKRQEDAVSCPRWSIKRQGASLSCDMASLEQTQEATEKELKLAKLESNFYKACSAVRHKGIELNNIRNCLLQELLEIEENKNVELRKEIQEVQVS